MMIKLPFDLDRYFVRTSDTIEVPLSDLTIGSPHAIKKAEQLMLAAYNGERQRRAPISIVPSIISGYRVIDGSSTLANAVIHRWPTILAVVVEERNV